VNPAIRRRSNETTERCLAWALPATPAGQQINRLPAALFPQGMIWSSSPVNVHANHACEVAADHAEEAWPGQQIGLATLIQSDFSPNFALLSSLRQSRYFTDILWKSI
jgi:hypothetical protein